MDNSNIISLSVNLSFLIIFLIISIFMVSKIKMENRGYKLLFVTYLIFWIPLMMTREYSGKVQNIIDKNITAYVLASYGIIGIFCRPFVDWLAIKIKNRKLILYLAILFVLISFIPFLVVQNNGTSIIQSIGIGIGASMIGTYELMFKEQYTNNKSYLTVSLLAIPPLLADFISSAIQSLLTTLPIESIKIDLIPLNYLMIWIISILFLIITFILITFIKENRNTIGIYNNNQFVLNDSKKITIFWFVMVCLLGFIIAFVKFSNSGSVAITNLEHINDLSENKYNTNLIKSLQGYISLVFSIFQLIASFVIYWLTVVRKRINTLFVIGISSWITYHSLILIIKNPIFYFSMSMFNGFAYGILYNLILGMILNTSFSTNKITPMGIYQSILAIGISSSSFFTPFIKENLNNSFEKTNLIVNLTIISMLIILFFVYFLNLWIVKKWSIYKKL